VDCVSQESPDGQQHKKGAPLSITNIREDVKKGKAPLLPFTN
jgi:hypothetical protein